MSALLLADATLESRSFWELFGYAFGVLFIFNLADLLILDWLIVRWFEPWWMEHIVIPKQYFHHFRGFLVGTVGVAIEGSCHRFALESATVPRGNHGRPRLLSLQAVGRGGRGARLLDDDRSRAHAGSSGRSAGRVGAAARDRRRLRRAADLRLAQVDHVLAQSCYFFVRPKRASSRSACSSAAR